MSGATSTANGGLPLSPDQIRLVLDSLSEGVCTVDHDWAITSFNQSAQAMTGLPSEEALGAPFSTLVDCGMLECRDLLQGVMGSGTTVRDVATRITSRKGQRIPVTMNAIISSEDIANAMDLRGFGQRKRTWLYKLEYHWWDWVVIVFSVALLVIILVLAYRFGMSGFEVPTWWYRLFN